MNYYLGLDLGTSGLKTVIFDLNGREIAQRTEEYPVYQPQAGWSEQDPEDWYQAALKTVREVLGQSGIAAADVKGIGISGQMMGVVPLDKDGQVLRRAILWNDGRTTEASENIRAKVGDELFKKISLTPIRPGLSIAKIQWVREHEPEIFAKAHHFLLPKDYLRYRLTGEYATEVSDASATQLLDVAKREWSKELHEAMDLRVGIMGKVYESQEITGYLLPAVADAMGLTVNCAVVGGAADNPAAAIGTGIVNQGEAMTTIGTSGTVVAYSDKPHLDENESVYTHCLPIPDAWYFMGSVNSCGASLRWWRDTFYPDDIEYHRINQEAILSKPGSNNLIYLPYLNGEQSPHFNLNLRGSFVGLSAIHTRGDMTRAVMEGATFALNDILQSIRDTGVEPEHVVFAGGGSKGSFWRQLMADIYDLPVHLPIINSANAGALGVAILAMVGTGAYDSVREAVDEIITYRNKVYYPFPDAVETYKDYHKEFRALYPKLKDNFKSIIEL